MKFQLGSKVRFPGLDGVFTITGVQENPQFSDGYSVVYSLLDNETGARFSQFECDLEEA